MIKLIAHINRWHEEKAVRVSTSRKQEAGNQMVCHKHKTALQLCGWQQFVGVILVIIDDRWHHHSAIGPTHKCKLTLLLSDQSLSDSVHRNLWLLNCSIKIYYTTELHGLQCISLVELKRHWYKIECPIGMDWV